MVRIFVRCQGICAAKRLRTPGALREGTRAEALELTEDRADLAQDAFWPCVNVHSAHVPLKMQKAKRGVSLAPVGRRRKCAGPREGSVSVCAAGCATHMPGMGRDRMEEGREEAVVCSVCSSACRWTGVTSRSAKSGVLAFVCGELGLRRDTSSAVISSKTRGAGVLTRGAQTRRKLARGGRRGLPFAPAGHLSSSSACEHFPFVATPMLEGQAARAHRHIYPGVFTPGWLVRVAISGGGQIWANYMLPTAHKGPDGPEKIMQKD